MKYIETNIPRISDTREIEELMVPEKPTPVLASHLELGFEVTGGSITLYNAQLDLTVVLDADTNTLTATAGPRGLAVALGKIASGEVKLETPATVH